MGQMAKAKAAATSVSAPKPKDTNKSARGPTTKSEWGGGAAQLEPRAKRKLCRRSSDEQATRAMKLKLGMFPSVQLSNNLDSDNNSVLRKSKRSREEQRKTKDILL